MLVIVITGGLGAGKSLAASYLAERGALRIDTDELAKELIEPGAPAYGPVLAAFGADVLEADGRVSHARLARRAFADAASAEALDAAVHPHVTDALAERLQGIRAEDPAAVVLVEVPMLVEAPEVAELADLVVSVEAPGTERIERAVARGLDREDAIARMERQAGPAERARVADVVLDNSGSLEDFEEELDALWRREVAPRVS